MLYVELNLKKNDLGHNGKKCRFKIVSYTLLYTTDIHIYIYNIYIPHIYTYIYGIHIYIPYVYVYMECTHIPRNRKNHITLYL